MLDEWHNQDTSHIFTVLLLVTMSLKEGKKLIMHHQKRFLLLPHLSYEHERSVIILSLLGRSRKLHLYTSPMHFQILGDK